MLLVLHLNVYLANPPHQKKELMVDLNSLQLEQIIVFCDIFTKQNEKKKIMRLIRFPK